MVHCLATASRNMGDWSSRDLVGYRFVQVEEGERLNWKHLKKYKNPMGIFLVLDGALSWVFFSGQPWYFQVGRFLRLGIGLLLLRG